MHFVPPEPQSQAARIAGPPSWMVPVTPVIPDHELVRRIGGGSYGDVWLARTAVGTWRAVKVVYRDRFTDDRPYDREFSGMRKFEPLSRGNEAFVDILQIGRNDAEGYFYYVMELADDAAGIPGPEGTFGEGRAHPSTRVEITSKPTVGPSDAGVGSHGSPGKPAGGPPEDRDTGRLPHPELSAPERGDPLPAETYVPLTLSRVLMHRGRLPAGECLNLGITLNLGLAHLHEAGLIHRDIKPSNIIFVGGVPKLADIGLVIEVAEAHSFVGTEGFIPPEGPNSPQADIFSLGKVLYEAVMGKDRKDFPEPLSQLASAPDATQLLEFNAILLKACAANREDRYRSAVEMNADLALLQSGGSVRRQRKLAGHLRRVERIGALAMAVAALVTLGWWWQARQTGIVRDLAGEKARMAADRTRLADENRERIVRLDVANGIREMDHGDFGASLVWLSEALALTTNGPADAGVQAIRIQQLLALHPRLLHVFPHPGGVASAEFSPDEGRVVTAGRDGVVRIWDMARDERPAAEFRMDGALGRARFTRDGRRLWVEGVDESLQPRVVALLDAGSGQPAFPPVTNATASELSPDDRWLVVARTNGIVQILAADTGRWVADARGHEGRVVAIGFSSDSSQFLTASHDRTVRRWHTITGEPIGQPLNHDQAVARVVFSQDGGRIASATATDDPGGPMQFQTWDAATGRALGKPIAGFWHPAMLAFDLGGRRILTGDREAGVRVLDVDSHQPVTRRLEPDSPVRSLALSPDGAYAALGTDAGTVGLWDLETGLRVLATLRHSGRVESVRFSSDGSRLLTSGDDGTAKVWDLALPQVSRSIEFPSHQHPAAALSPDGRHLLVGIVDVPARLRSIELPALTDASGSLPAATRFPIGGMVSFDSTGQRWATAFDPASYLRMDYSGSLDAPFAVGLWQRDGTGIRNMSLDHPTRVVGCYFNDDGTRLLTVGWDRVTRVWNTADGTLQQSFRRPESDAAWMAVSPDLRTAVAVVRDALGWHVVFRDVQTGLALGRPYQGNPDITAAQFSPDGSRVGTVGADQCGRVWDARTGEPVTGPFKHGGALTHIEWSPDGRRVLTAGQSPDVKVWDAVTGEPSLPPLRMRARPVEQARFSADGRFIVARSDEDLVRVWDAATGEAVTPFLPHPDTVRHVFVTAARQLVSIQNSGMVRVWDLFPSPVPIAELTELTHLLAGRSPGARPPGFAPAEQLAASLRSLRSRQPGLFLDDPRRIPEWHRQQIPEPSTPKGAMAAVFHLERLARWTPGDPVIEERLRRYRAALIPARPPDLPSQLLDLTRAYTRSFDLLPRREFAELPRGRQTLAGTEFDLRGIVHLDRRSDRSDAVGPFHSSAVIEVRQRCRQLHFLQATEGEPRVDGSVVARWIIHYADGSAREWPLIYGVHVRDWWLWTRQEPLTATGATLAWQGRAEAWNRPDTGGIRLFKASWPNPQPDVEITGLEFQMGETALKPFVVAITAE